MKTMLFLLLLTLAGCGHDWDCRIYYNKLTAYAACRADSKCTLTSAELTDEQATRRAQLEACYTN